VGLTPTRVCTTAPGPRAITIVATSTINGGVQDSVAATLTVLSYGDPSVSVTAVDDDVEPSETGSYDLTATNGGNAVDTMSLSFTGVDFGTAYRAIPTAIPGAWVSFAPPAPSASACGSAPSVLTITVPPDWAAMEDATYQFVVEVTSAIDGASGTDTGQLIVRATPLSRMYYVRAECAALNATVAALPPSDVRDGLLDKSMAACAKFDEAMARYVAGDDPPASNLFRTVQNILAAFGNQLDAQRGKGLTEAQWLDLSTRATQIVADVDAILAVI
ncbi:MAG TPA: hypothetical protein VGR51_01520, partial [Thermoplasmata archaeon]|nr:hypothetical protein [Thermoplasmata archaeon]